MTAEDLAKKGSIEAQRFGPYELLAQILNVIVKGADMTGEQLLAQLEESGKIDKIRTGTYELLAEIYKALANQAQAPSPVTPQLPEGIFIEKGKIGIGASAEKEGLRVTGLFKMDGLAIDNEMSTDYAIKEWPVGFPPGSRWYDGLFRCVTANTPADEGNEIFATREWTMREFRNELFEVWDEGGTEILVLNLPDSTWRINAQKMY